VVLFPVQWEEPWGLVPLEAMAVGRPVVASGTGGSAEYLRHEENALIYAPRDSAEALATAVRRLADDASLRSRLRDGGFPTAARFTERRYNEAIENALAEATGATPCQSVYPAAP
jgi:glycosyltransferase involved in cell wall biosynthesis